MTERQLGLVFSAAMFVFSLAVLIVSTTAGWRFYSALMPIIFSSFAVVFTALVLLRDILAYRRSVVAEAPVEEPLGEEGASLFETAPAALIFLIWMLLIFGGTYVIGLMASMILGTIGYMKIIGKAKWTVSIITAAGVTLVSYLVYDRLIAIVWPRPWLAAYIPGLF